MEIARQLFRLALLGAINHQVTHIVVAGSIFAGTRARCTSTHPKLGQLVSCHLCFGTWVGFLMALLFRPNFMRQARLGQPLQPYGLLRRVAAFGADAFAISLAGRFFTETLAILANRAALEDQRREVLEQQERLLDLEARQASR